MATEVEWAKLPAPEIRKIAANPEALVILPVGSLEQHGPHLPTITDTQSASEAAIRAARLAAGDPHALVLPGMWTGMSEHHLPFGGTISLNYSEFHGVLRGVVRSLKALGFSRLLIVNGHGGNVDALALSARELAHEFGLPIVATTPWSLEPDKVAAVMESDTCARHACEGETSVMMVATPHLVRKDRFDEAMRQAPQSVDVPPGFSRFYSFAERAPVTGTRGDPRTASPEKGERFLAIQAEALVRAMRNKALWTTPDDVWAKQRGQGPMSGRAS